MRTEEPKNRRTVEPTNVRYDLKKPFATLVEMKQNENWRSLVEKFRTVCEELAAS